MSAVENLKGLTIEDGWKVTTQLVKSSASTGGVFSESYLAEKDGKIAFLKAFDFSDAFEDGADTFAVLKQHIVSYEHERSILDHLGAKRLSNVVLALGAGKVSVPGFGKAEGQVHYLLFERAASDIRCQMDVADAADYVWCMRVLRDVCLGLFQVHNEFIAHQDLKPSNVLVCNEAGFKIADFGRSSRRGTDVWHDEFVFPGDRTYSPPELLYKHIDPEFITRRMGSDMYMLGNLAVFLFTGTNLTSTLFAKMQREHHWNYWASSYSEVLPYVQEAFARCLEELSAVLPPVVRADVVEIVTCMCNPDLSKRGYPKTIGKGTQYSLERFLSKLTHLVKLLEVRIRVTAKAS